MQRVYGGDVSQLGDREIAVIASTSQLARDGHVLVTTGIDITNYKRNPIVLWQHNMDSPIGVCTAIGIENGNLAARIQFAPQGDSVIADQACALVKSGIVRGISIGFDAVDTEPLDPRRPYGGQRITSSELYEISVVSVPADVGATVTARRLQGASSRTIATLNALRPIGEAALQRAWAKMDNAAPGVILNPTMHAWAYLQASEAEQRAREQEDEQKRSHSRSSNTWASRA